MTDRIFEALDQFSERLAVIDEAESPLTYRALLERADALGSRLPPRALTVVICKNTADCLAGYLGFMRAGGVLLLLHHSTSAAQLADIIADFRPGYLFSPADYAFGSDQGETLATAGEYTLRKLERDAPARPHQELCLLLTTSGTTGSRAFVRLSHRNLASNARAIAQYLNIRATDRAITTMPMSYTFGLSILHSHLIQGAAVILTEAPLVSPAFWSLLKRHQATTFGGVPFIYEMLKKLRFAKMDLPSLRYLTQAGGKLNQGLVAEFIDTCAAKGIRFIVMYGQTEATARISYLPWESAREKAGSIGIAIPGGELGLMDDDGIPLSAADTPGELVYRGDNVSLGYAHGSADLALGDENTGLLHTGDMAVRDRDGFYTIVGRKKRFLKLFGHRVNLDEVEQILKNAGHDCACTGEDDDLRIFIPGGGHRQAVLGLIHERINLNPHGYRIVEIDAIPRSESGKVDYSSLKALAETSRTSP